MNLWIRLVVAILGIGEHSVILVNHTGLKIVRIEIGDRKFEDVNNKYDEILIDVIPEKHNMRIVFRGGGHIDWTNFDFRGIHEIIFERVDHSIRAHRE